jgi:hypothetical protein
MLELLQLLFCGRACIGALIRTSLYFCHFHHLADIVKTSAAFGVLGSALAAPSHFLIHNAFENG